MKKMQWGDEEIKTFCKRLDSHTYLQCNKCGHLLTFPSEQLIEKSTCINCGQKYKETHSIIRSINNDKKSKNKR